MSDLLIKLWQNGILQLGIWETIYMTLISTFFAYLIGLPVGLILRMTDRDGIHPIGWLNRTLGIIVNALRSIPFIILMVAMLPVAKAIVGTSLGNRAVIVTLVIAAAPYVARMVESAAKEVDAGVIEAALSMGASTLRIIWKVIIPEIKPGIVSGALTAFTMSIDDFVISYFTSGTTQTLPIYIYSMTRKRISPEINALSTVLFVCIMLLLIIINVRQGREERRAKKAERERA